MLAAMALFHPLCSQDYESLKPLIDSCNQAGDYQCALTYATQALAYEEAHSGKESENYPDILYDLAVCEASLGDYTSSETHALEALELIRTKKGRSPEEEAYVIDQLVVTSFNLGKLEEAADYCRESMKIKEKTLGREHESYGSSLGNLAVITYSLGDYEEAERLFDEALQLTAATAGTESDQYSLALNNLAALSHANGNYSKALKLLVEANALDRKNYGASHPVYATSLSNLGTMYFETGNDYKAELLYAEAMRIRERALGKQHPDYNHSLRNLAGVYSNRGDYARAEDALLDVLENTANSQGTQHVDYASSLDRLATLYADMGNFEKAERMYLEALDIFESRLGKEHKDYAVTLINLAGLYDEMQEHDKAKSLTLEALEIFRKATGTLQPEYASALINLGDLYHAEGAYKKADETYTEVLDILHELYDFDHPAEGRTLVNMAINDYHDGQPGKAEQKYMEALGFYKAGMGPNHPYYISTLTNLAILYYRTDQYERARPVFSEINDRLNEQVQYYFGFLTEKEREDYIENKINNTLGVYSSYTVNAGEQYPGLHADMYDNALLHKGLQLYNNAALRQAIYFSGDNSLIATYEQYLGVQKQISDLFTEGNLEDNVVADSLKALSDRLEKEIIGERKNLRGTDLLEEISQTGYRDVQRALGPEDAAIEIVNFRYFDTDWTDSVFYYALVLRRDSEYPSMVRLFEEEQIVPLLSNQNATTNPAFIQTMYNNDAAIRHFFRSDPPRKTLYELSWEPIDSLLHGITNIFIAPSGLLHRVSYDALKDREGRYLSDRYNIQLLSSTRQIAGMQRAMSPFLGNFSAVLYGGIEYQVDSTLMVSQAMKYQEDQSYNLLASRSLAIPESARGVDWPYLPGTLREISAIEEQFREGNVHCEVFIGSDASEESFKHLTDASLSPEIIHIATHGFFFPASATRQAGQETTSTRAGGIQPRFTAPVNPLYRSGLLFSGAGRAWKNAPVPQGVEDGTLTAYEVSNLNLLNTELVILSACETGLGEIRGNEGVYGLRRAFKMAGVHYLVTSLWQVPDRQTSELMEHFYTALLQGIEVREAFRGAQDKMKAKYDPYYWAAFVLLE